jgi:hypothetical protein
MLGQAADAHSIHLSACDKHCTRAHTLLHYAHRLLTEAGSWLHHILAFKCVPLVENGMRALEAHLWDVQLNPVGLQSHIDADMKAAHACCDSSAPSDVQRARA